MTDNIATVALAAMNAYAASDLDGLMALLTDDIQYALYLDEAELPFAGETRGKDLLLQRIGQMHGAFEYVLFRPFKVRVVDNAAHNQVEFMYRHKATNELLTGRFRFVLIVKGGLVARIEEYHDAERIKAFARLVGGVTPS
ncbi:MAG: nuclear transport factor 2 family protein [Hyphomicrobiaceae bacterium]